MFSGSLRFNLDFQGHHSDEEIWAALRLARLDRLVMDMPLKLDEPVEETLGCC
jgi:ABC-type multidrug transport system fused ATPase/permease subunit